MPTIKINVEKCKGCWFCIEACPQKIIKLSGKINAKGYKYPEMTSDKCIGCGMCYKVCPDCCIEVLK
ncbi:ferredoxin family protein [Nanoarchaeota archaeon]